VAEFSLRGPGSCGDEPCCDEHRGDERGGDGSWPGGTGGGVPGSWADGLPFAGMMVAVPVPPDAYGTDSLAGIGPDGFADGGPLDVMPPGPLLEMLTEQVVTGTTPFNWTPGTSEDWDEAGAEAASRAAAGEPLAGIPGVPGAAGVRDLTAGELLGAISAVRRMADRAEWMTLALASELVRRRLAEEEAAAVPVAAAAAPSCEHRPDEQQPDTRLSDAPLPGTPRRRRPGLLDAYATAAEELRFQLALGPREADDLVSLAIAAPGRLPAMLARMAQGMASARRILAVHRATADLSDEDARLVDAALAPRAHELTAGQLGERARYLAMKLDPASADRRLRRGKKDTRVETWQEGSGNAALAGRELDPAVVLAANAYYDSIAALLKRAGLPGTLRELRALAFTDRNTGKDPLDRIPGYPAAGPGQPAGPRADGPGQPPADPARPPAGGPVADDLRDDGRRDDERWNPGDDNGNDEGRPAGTVSPFPASVHLLVPVGTLLGWSGAPGQASRLGLLGPRATRDLVQAASGHPRTRWQVTLTGADGTAIAHGRARGRHPWQPASATGPPGNPTAMTLAGQAAQAADLLARLGVTFTPVVKDRCDHSGHEDRYVPSDQLKALIRARDATCPAPGCGARSAYSDLDHTTPWPAGSTDQCNLGPPCRRHHKLKQTPGWRLRQPQPGVFRWTAPSGRTYTTTPTVYDP
jgi:hypothetical protein